MKIPPFFAKGLAILRDSLTDKEKVLKYPIPEALVLILLIIIWVWRPAKLAFLFKHSIEDWRNIVLIIAGPVGFMFALWRGTLASQQTKIAENSANMDRFQKGSQMLSSDRLSVRQAGIIILNDLANSQISQLPGNKAGFPLMCAQVLERFVVDRGNEKEAQSEEDGQETPLPIQPDAQSASNYLIDIRSKLGLGVELRSANLFDANLADANLTGAQLFGANLTKADLSVANLTTANLSDADLSDADLSLANLTRAQLFGANLTKADLSVANLAGANLFAANLARANLTQADLSDAILPGNIHELNDDPDRKPIFTNCRANRSMPPGNLPSEIKIIYYG